MHPGGVAEAAAAATGGPWTGATSGRAPVAVPPHVGLPWGGHGAFGSGGSAPSQGSKSQQLFSGQLLCTRSQTLLCILTSLGIRSATRLRRRCTRSTDKVPDGGFAWPPLGKLVGGLAGAENVVGRPVPRAGYVTDFLVVPVLLVMLASFFFYPLAVEILANRLDSVALTVIKGDVSQYMQNFFNYNGLLFSFFASQTYSCLYSQQESMYEALYVEAAEARSLLEQLTLISKGRPSYRAMLDSMRVYVRELALGVRSGCPPAVLVSAKPVSDPLENILYLTSVGMPSVVYDTVRSLRQARGVRLGATQRKLPEEHFLLLRVLGILELLAFPLLGAGISTYEAASEAFAVGHILWVQSVVFSFLAGGVFLTLQVIQDLRSPTSGLYSLDNILEEMVDGLQDELDKRIANAPSEAEVSGELDAGSDGRGLAYDVGLLRGSDPRTCLQPVSEDLSLPRILAFCAFVGLCAAAVFPALVGTLRDSFSGPALQAIREDNNAQWLQNFFTGVGLIFSLFVAQTFGFLYGQQEQIYLALYSEVSEAKALLEQLSLVCRGRPSYGEMLQELQSYVRDDLQRLDRRPTQLLASTAGPDPLENVLYATSVGVPSGVYETVRGLRQARGERLGATQKKLPEAHFAILNVLGALELSVFPILAAGCAALDAPGAAGLPGHILYFHAVLFGLMSSAVALTLSVLWDLWSPVGETYNVRTILKEMVSGLEQELALRIDAAGGLGGELVPIGAGPPQVATTQRDLA